jgi:pyruvate formate lyase activating enzyme
MTQTGMIFDIQRFSLYDGPGIRTTVFLKGCPLRCLWCHNPEGYEYGPELSYDRETCTDSAALCRPGVVEIIGRMYHVCEVMDLVMRDLPFYQAGQGGLTLSGGEPMAQPEFAIELAQSAKSRGLHVCLETSGYCETSDLV